MAELYTEAGHLIRQHHGRTFVYNGDSWYETSSILAAIQSVTPRAVATEWLLRARPREIRGRDTILVDRGPE